MASDLNGWTIDLEGLYGNRWKDRQKWHLMEDLWESPDGKLGAALWAIAEFGVGKAAGPLAVFTDKASPKLVLRLPKLECWHLIKTGVQFGKGVLFVHQFKQGWTGTLKVIPCAVNPADGKIARIDALEGFFYDVTHVDADRYRFVSQETKREEIVDLSKLPWA